MKRAVGVVAVMASLLVGVPAAGADTGVQHLHFHAGPYLITPGANLILVDRNKVPKPTVDGYMVKMVPSLRYASSDGSCCGAVPRVDVIHLHHGVWLSTGAAGEGEGNGYGLYPFMAAGEEKTIYSIPHGYGYPVGGKDAWILNYMIHNLTSHPARVYITYDVDFIPMSSPAAAVITPVHPIWMDVQDHNVYPVFDVHRYSGRNGKFTYPDMASDPYRGQASLNLFTVDHPGTLVATAGHLHPGGLYDDLDLIRSGATSAGGTTPGSVPHSVRLFRSFAHYFDKRGPISWDMAMTATAPDWRPRVNPGDQLRVSATYETKRASWYESMGIMVVWEAWNDQTGVDPFAHAVDLNGHVTHGHLPEDDHHGGAPGSVGANLKSFPTCLTSQVTITVFQFTPGDFAARGSDRCTPTVRRGHQLTFFNQDANPLSTFSFAPSQAYLQSIFHSITSCQYPCGFDTGISYPLANGAGGYDSGQLGFGTPAVGRVSWTTPTNLPPGTYTYFCRIHPFMRGVFRIIK